MVKNCHGRLQCLLQLLPYLAKHFHGYLLCLCHLPETDFPCVVRRMSRSLLFLWHLSVILWFKITTIAIVRDSLHFVVKSCFLWFWHLPVSDFQFDTKSSLWPLSDSLTVVGYSRLVLWLTVAIVANCVSDICLLRSFSFVV